MNKGAATRAAVLDHAVMMTSEVGFDALTIGSLAQDVGMSKSGLFGHFKSKENLQLAVLEEAVQRFTTNVIAPALQEARGEPRVRALFHGWQQWVQGSELPGGCIFIAAANEFDDRPGALRDLLVHYQEQWVGGLAKAAQLAVGEGHFRPDLDVEQFAWEFYSIILAHHHTSRLMRDDRSDQRAEKAFERLIANSKP